MCLKNYIKLVKKVDFEKINRYRKELYVTSKVKQYIFTR